MGRPRDLHQLLADGQLPASLVAEPFRVKQRTYPRQQLI